MRVITGTARGKRLETVPGTDLVRPTADRVKEGLFSAIQFDLEGRRVLDLFAGSGQLGIEALSRGAASAVFVDRADDAIAVVKRNLEHTALTENARVFKADYASFCATCRDTFDIALLDPPYTAGYFESAIAAVAPLMSDYGMIWCEHPKEITLPATVAGFCAVRSYRYGHVSAELYKKQGAHL